MSWRERIERNAEVEAGKPIIKGTGLAVQHVLDMLACGVSEAEILAKHPGLSHDDILACVACADEGDSSF